MAFIRTKRQRGQTYAYVVETYWDPTRGAPRQRVLAYLGRVPDIDPEAVPEPHRGDPAVVRWLTEHGVDVARGEHAGVVSADRRRLVEAIVAADRRVAEETACRLLEARGARRFLDHVMVPLVEDLSDAWTRERLSPADCKIVARGVAEMGVRLRLSLRLESPRPDAPLRVLLASPRCEPHALGVEILECAVVAEGHEAVALVGDLSAVQVAVRAEAMRPDLVLIHATLEASAPAALRLARTILDRLPEARGLLVGPAFRVDRVDDARIGIAQDGVPSIYASLREASA